MGKLEPFQGMKTRWLGLWYSAESHSYKSAALSFGDLRKFKGNFRLILRKNKFYEKGTNKPNLVFMLIDSQSDNPSPFEVEKLSVDGRDFYHTTEGERLYTEDEVRSVMRGACRDGRNGYDEFDLLIEDYI